MWEDVSVLSLKGTKFRVIHDKQFLDKRCGIEKNCWLDYDCIWEEVEVMCVLWFLCDFIVME
jgi:hypothetical protein